MSELFSNQVRFARMVPRLIDCAFALGLDVTIGEVQRSPDEAARNAAQGDGIARSLHIICLAIDLKLFRNGVYLTRSEDYRELGEFWETLGPGFSWGGRFHKPDGGHFSLAYNGVR